MTSLPVLAIYIMVLKVQSCCKSTMHDPQDLEMVLVIVHTGLSAWHETQFIPLANILKIDNITGPLYHTCTTPFTIITFLMDNLCRITTLEVSVTVLLLTVLITTQLYIPVYSLVTFGTVKTPRDSLTGTPFGSRISNVVIAGMLFVVHVMLNSCPSSTITSGNTGCARTEIIMREQIEVNTCSQ